MPHGNGCMHFRRSNHDWTAPLGLVESPKTPALGNDLKVCPHES